MIKFTLDTNCIISVDENRADAPAVQALAIAHGNGTASVAAVAISASERQQHGKPLRSFTPFEQRLAALNLSHLEILPAMAYMDICYFDHCVTTDAEMERLKQSIHGVLFPQLEFEWANYCASRGLDSSSPVHSKWLNAKCDVQALWSHINAGRDVFVTSDENFHAASRKSRLFALGAGRIERPQDALALLS